MILQLERPLVFLDFETTGLDVKNDRILELAFIRLLPDGTREEFVQRINPGIEVSKTAAKVTGIHSNDAMGLFWGPPLKKVGDKLLEFLGDSDIAGFNQINYDMPLWRNECKRHDIPYREGHRAQVDVKVIFNVCEKTWDRFLMGPRNLSAAANASRCVLNFTQHSFLSTYDDLGVNKWWLNEVSCRIVDYLANAVPFPVAAARDACSAWC